MPLKPDKGSWTCAPSVRRDPLAVLGEQVHRAVDCSSFCAIGEPCSITADGDCDAFKAPLTQEQYREHVKNDPAAKKFWREIHEAFGPLSFVDAHRVRDETCKEQKHSKSEMSSSEKSTVGIAD